MKTETKHTPGPWRVGPENCGSGRNIYSGRDYIGHSVGYNARPGSNQRTLNEFESEANAALIARAPDLLAENERLKTVLRRIIAMHDDAMFICGSDDSAIVEKNLGEARAALNPLKP